MRMMQFPIAFIGVGLLACILGIAYVLMRKPSNRLSRELNISLWSSAAIIAVVTLVLSYFFFNGYDHTGVDFRLGWISPWLSTITGMAAGILLGILAERYTSEQYKESKNIADLAKEDPALVIIDGTSTGWRSCLPACVTLGGAWDNAKKYIKFMKPQLVKEFGEERYSEIHNAGIIGDTVGDGYKDVVGPNQDIMIKMMATISVIMLPVMSAFNLVSLIK